MSYKIFNFLFDWDYIYWKNSADKGIERVYKTNDNTVYYYRYKLTTVIDIISDKSQVIWLTCMPEKYLTEEV